MLALQVSIGAANDVVDAATDRNRRPPKPIAEGLLSRRAGILVAAMTAGVGLILAAPSGTTTVAVAIAGLTCGYAYDLVFKRTAFAWLPLAVALPLVPLFTWLGATGSVPAGLAIIVPLGMLAGAGLAVGNALADLGPDLAGGTPSIARRLGRTGAWSLHATTLAAALLGLLGAYPRTGGDAALALVLVGAAALGLGIAGLAVAGGAPGQAGLARRSWQVEALGVAALGVGWLVAFAGARPGGG